jgi:hypothetical protein
MHFADLFDTRPAGIVLSPSQIEKYDRCKRRWALEYIGGIRAPPHPSAKLGLAVHAILEAWLGAGVPPDATTRAGKIAARMIRNLPPPGTGAVERSFFFKTRNGIVYQGFIDWSGVFFDWPTNVDHKTTGNLDPSRGAVYAKSEVDLHNDVQALTYTVAGCMGFGVDEMQLLWNYGSTKDKEPETRPVRTKLRLPVVIEKFERVLDPLGAEIVEQRTLAADPMSFPPNPAACSDHGGCPHPHICNLSAEERLYGIMNQPPSLAQRLAVLPQPIPGFAPPQPAPQAPGGFVSGRVPGTVQYPPPGQPPAPPGFAPPQPTPGFAPPAQGFAPPPQTAQGAPGGFAPPPGSAFAPAPPAATQGAFSPEQGPNPPESGGMPPPPPPPAPAQVAATDAPKRGRGRPRKEASAEAQMSLPGVPLAPPQTSEAIFLRGVFAWMSNPNWNGSMEQLQWAGRTAVEFYGALARGQ